MRAQFAAVIAVEAKRAWPRFDARPQRRLRQIEADQDADQFRRIVALAVERRAGQQIADAARTGRHALGDRPVEAAVELGRPAGMSASNGISSGVMFSESQTSISAAFAHRRSYSPRAAHEHIMPQRAVQAHVLHQFAQQRIVEPLRDGPLLRR